MDSCDFGLEGGGFWAFASWYGLRGVYGGLQTETRWGRGPKGDPSLGGSISLSCPRFWGLAEAAGPVFLVIEDHFAVYYRTAPHVCRPFFAFRRLSSRSEWVLDFYWELNLEPRKQTRKRHEVMIHSMVLVLVLVIVRWFWLQIEKIPPSAG